MRRTIHLSLCLVLTAVFLGAGSAAVPHEEEGDFCLDDFYAKGGGRPEFSAEGRPVRIEGDLTVLMAMSREGTIGCGYFLRGTEAGEKQPKDYTVLFDEDPPPGLHTGTRVVAHGKLTGSFLSVGSGSDPSSFSTTSTDLAAVSGNLNVNVILVNFLDSVLAATPADIQGMVSTRSSSLSNYYRETSYGKLTVTCTVRGPYTINYNGLGNCQYGAWASAADAAAGVTGGYRMYVLAPSGCGWAGLATLRGTQSWINGSNWSWQAAYTHEFGHNLGMHHATAAGGEYADHSCTMGNPSLPPHTNGPHKVEMGWMATGTVTGVSGGTQTFLLSALELSAATPQIVRIPKTDTGGSYYVSFRAPLGLDATNLSSGYRYRTTVHHWSDTGGTRTTLAAAIADGTSWSDPATGLSVTQTSHNDTSATVTITTAAANEAPVITSGPTATPNSVSLPGTATVSVTATDSDGPSALTYTWSTAAGPGSASFSPNGTTASNTSTASFPSAGTYTLRVTVSDGRSSVQGSVGITVSDPNLINAPGGLSATASGRTVTLRWTDNSGNEDGFAVQRAPKSSGNSPGTFTTVARLGPNATTYAEGLSAAGTYHYRVQAFANDGRTSTYSNTVKIRVR
jgi:hypothetical protein